MAAFFLARSAAAQTAAQQGQALWQANHCADCHGSRAEELGYFNASETLTISRAKVHGLSGAQGKLLYAYIRSQLVPHPPSTVVRLSVDNPPFQPGPGLRQRGSVAFAAGAGPGAVLSSDQAMLPYLLPMGRIVPIDPVNLPISLPLLKLSDWFPITDPFLGFSDFAASPVVSIYNQIETDCQAGQIGRALSLWPAWDSAALRYYQQHTLGYAGAWTIEQAQNLYSVAQWVQVKNLELYLRYLAPAGMGWQSNTTFRSSPYLLQIPSSAGLFNGDPVKYETVNNGWYWLQLVLKHTPPSGDHAPVDWNYTRGRIKDLGQITGTPYAARMMASLIIGLQTYAPYPITAGPAGLSMRNDGNLLDLCHPAYTAQWLDYNPAVKARLLNLYLAYWLTLAEPIPPDLYWQYGYGSSAASPQDQPSVRLPGAQASWANEMWETVPSLRADGVDPGLLSELSKWSASVWPLGNWSTH
jgi:hypothetical protein